MAILEDGQTSSVFLRMEVAQTLAATKAEDAYDLFVRLALDAREHSWLRELLTADLAVWNERLSDDLLLTLLADPEPAVCAATLSVWRELPSQSIPIERIVPYCTHEQKYIREAAIKTLLATEQRAPVDPILSALNDPEPEVRAAASHACLSLAEWFPDRIPLERLLAALHDEHPPVREDALDALGKIPLRIPVEPVIAALSDPVPYVRCAAIETLGMMGERVPASIYPTLRELSGADDSAHVRQRATRTLLLLHGMPLPPLRMPVIEITSEEDLRE